MESSKLVVGTIEDMKDLFENKGKFYNENTLIKYYEELYKIDEENHESLSVFKVNIRHPEKESGYKLPDGDMITVDQIYEQAKKYDNTHLKKENSKMDFKDIKSTVNKMINSNYEDFVKAIISVEKGINSKEALNTLYAQFMDNDGMNLLHEEFDYMIDELVAEGVITNDEKEVELSEYVGNIVADVKVEEVEGKNGKFKVANFSVAVNDDNGGSKFVNISAYGDKTKFVQDMKKGDFVKITGEERYSTNEKGNEYLSVKAVYSKILKAKGLDKAHDNETEKLSSEIKELKEAIKERELDLAYADSFEQSGQIREDIDKLKKELSIKESAYSSIKKSIDTKNDKKESTLRAIAKFKDKISDEVKTDEKKDKGVEL